MAHAVRGKSSAGYRVGLVVMGCFYMLGGVNHFWHPATYVAVMPPYLPWPAALVFWSGVAEVLGGIGVMVPWTRVFSAWGLVAMLAAFLPVHVNMCLHPEAFPGIPVWAMWLRLPLQFALMAWAWWYARPRPAN